MTNATSATLVCNVLYFRQAKSSAFLYNSSFLLFLTNYNEVNYLVEMGQAFYEFIRLSKKVQLFT